MTTQEKPVSSAFPVVLALTGTYAVFQRELPKERAAFQVSSLHGMPEVSAGV